MNPLNRRQFVSRLTVAAGTLALPKFSIASTFLRNQNGIQEYIDAEITHGKIRGIRQNGVNIFKGIPYAGRVSGDRRFCRPARLEPRTGVPGAKDVPEWPDYDLKTRATMRIDTNCEVIYDRFRQELQMWRSIGRL